MSASADHVPPLIVRKSYGGASVAMNSRELGATAVFAWLEAGVIDSGSTRFRRAQALAAAPAGRARRADISR